MTSEKNNQLFVLRALETLTKEIGDVQLSHARAFFYVGLAGEAGMDQGELARKLDTSPSATIRAVQALGKFHWLKDEHGNRRPGLDLIESTQNAQNFRLRTLTLTANGRKLWTKLGGK
jgi:DNA-binding MarR family transcriptional regulator